MFEWIIAVCSAYVSVRCTAKVCAICSTNEVEISAEEIEISAEEISAEASLLRTPLFCTGIDISAEEKMMALSTLSLILAGSGSFRD